MRPVDDGVVRGVRRQLQVAAERLDRGHGFALLLVREAETAEADRIVRRQAHRLAVGGDRALGVAEKSSVFPFS